MRNWRFVSLWFVVILLTMSCRGLGSKAPDDAALTITRVTPRATTVYYGQTTCGPTTLTVDVVVQADETPRHVGLQYRYIGTSKGDWRQITGTLVSQGQYQIALNLDASAAQAVGATALEYRAFAMDAQGDATYFPPQGTAQVRLQPCTPAGVVPPQNSGQSSGGGSAHPPAGGGAVAPPSGGGGHRNPPSGGGASNPPPSAGGTDLAIQDVRANPSDAVYFGPCTAGETTWLEIEAVVNDIQKVQSAAVHYRYESSLAPGDDFPNTAPMERQQGIGNYTAHIDVGQEVPDHAAVERVVYYVEMTTTDGRKIQSAPYFHPLLPCSNQGQVPPPSPTRITSVDVYPNIAFYGSCQAGEPTEVFFQISVEPTSHVATAVLDYAFYNGNTSIGKTGSLDLLLDQGVFVGQVDLSTALLPADVVDALVYSVEVTTMDGDVVTYGPASLPIQRCATAAAPTIVYFESLNPNNEAVPGTPFLLRWETENANCGVYLNGEVVNEDEPDEFAAGHAAFGAEGQTFSFTLEAYGGDCSQPLVDSATVAITVVSGDNDQGSGNDQYRMSNYEQLYFGESFDLDWDQVSDFYLFTNAFSLTLEPENGARMVFGTSADDKFQTLENCIAALAGAESQEISLDVNDIVCIQTGAGYYGYIQVSEVYQDFDDVTGSYITFSLFAQTVP